MPSLSARSQRTAVWPDRPFTGTSWTNLIWSTGTLINYWSNPLNTWDREKRCRKGYSWNSPILGRKRIFPCRLPLWPAELPAGTWFSADLPLLSGSDPVKDRRSGIRWYPISPWDVLPRIHLHDHRMGTLRHGSLPERPGTPDGGSYARETGRPFCFFRHSDGIKQKFLFKMLHLPNSVTFFFSKTLLI